MKVILKEDVDSLGSIGDVVEVKDGYGRNFLIPQKKAVKLSTKNFKILAHEKHLIENKLKRIEKEANTLAEMIEGRSFTISKQAGEDEKLFGSVTPIDIQKLLKEDGIEIDRKKILLSSPIKKLGTYPIAIKVHTGVTANINIQVNDIQPG